jgi:hypothetical protein
MSVSSAFPLDGESTRKIEKSWKTSYPTGGKTATTDLSQTRTKATSRRMQNKQDLKTNIQPWDRGWKVRWAPCVKVEKKTGVGKGLLVVRSDSHDQRKDEG